MEVTPSAPPEPPAAYDRPTGLGTEIWVPQITHGSTSNLLLGTNARLLGVLHEEGVWPYSSCATLCRTKLTEATRKGEY